MMIGEQRTAALVFPTLDAVAHSQDDHSCGPLWRVTLDDRKRVRVRDDAGVLHAPQRTSVLHRFALLLGVGDKKDVARVEVQLTSPDAGGSPRIWRFVFLVFMLLGIVCALFLAFTVFRQSPRDIVLSLPMFAAIPAFAWFLERRDRAAAMRRHLFVLVSNRMLDGHCGVCDYELTRDCACEDGKWLCAECGAKWDVAAWRVSFVIDETQPVTQTSLMTIRRAALAASSGSPVRRDVARAAAKASRSEFWGYVPVAIKGYLRRPSLGLFVCLALCVSAYFLGNFAASGTNSSREALHIMIMCYFVPFAFTCLLAWLNVSEKATALLHAQRRVTNTCEYCTSSLVFQRCVADRTVVCTSCGARRSQDLDLAQEPAKG